MRTSTISLSMPRACGEQWNSFKPTPNGGFCASCQKEVIDFSKATDEEVIRYFTQHRSQETCGRFRTDQLDRSLSERTIRPGWAVLQAGVLGLLMLAGSPVFAQTGKVSVESTATQASAAREFTGIIRSADDQSALPGVNVYLKDNPDVGTVSDADGRFRFPTKLKAGDIVMFSFIGMETVAFTVDNQSQPAEIAMSMNSVLTGEIVVGGVQLERPSPLHRFFSLFRRKY